MTNLKTAIIAGSMASLMGTSALALDLSIGVDAGVDANADDNAASLSIAAGVFAEADTEMDENADVMMAEFFSGYDVDSDSEFMSDVVFSTEGETLGEVDEVMVDAEGHQLVFIDIDDSLDTNAERIYIVLGTNLQSDGSINLDMTEAEFTSSLNAQVENQG